MYDRTTVQSAPSRTTRVLVLCPWDVRGKKNASSAFRLGYILCWYLNNLDVVLLWTQFGSKQLIIQAKVVTWHSVMRRHKFSPTVNVRSGWRVLLEENMFLFRRSNYCGDIEYFSMVVLNSEREIHLHSQESTAKHSCFQRALNLSSKRRTASRWKEIQTLPCALFWIFQSLSLSTNC